MIRIHGKDELMEELKEILDSMSTRVKSPFFGYFVFTWAVLNWKAWIYLVFSTADMFDRFTYFEANTTSGTLIWLPTAIAITLTLASTWFRWILLVANTKPTVLRSVQQAKADHQVLQEKLKLEEIRQSFQKTREEGLIEEAKRDEKISSIRDDGVRQKLQDQIDELREQAKNPVAIDEGTYGSDSFGVKSYGANDRLPEYIRAEIFRISDTKASLCLINGSEVVREIKFSLEKILDGHGSIADSIFEDVVIELMMPGERKYFEFPRVGDIDHDWKVKLAWKDLDGDLIRSDYLLRDS